MENDAGANVLSALILLAGLATWITAGYDKYMQANDPLYRGDRVHTWGASCVTVLFICSTSLAIKTLL